MDNNHQLVTQAVDFLAPPDRFVSSSHLYGRLHRYQLLLRKFWWIPGLVLVVVLGPVYLFTRGLPPAYTSKARMWLTGRLNINEGRLYTEELIDYLSTQTELLQSSTIQQRALARLRDEFPKDFLAVTVSGSRRSSGPLRKIARFVKSLAGVETTGTNATEVVSPFKLK